MELSMAEQKGMGAYNVANRRAHARKHSGTKSRALGSSQPVHNVLATSPEDPLKVLTSRTYRGPLGDYQETNTKIDDLTIKFDFGINSPCITCLFLFLTGRTNIQKFSMGMITGRVWDPVAGRPWDQMMRRFGDVCGTLVKHVF